LIFGNKDFKNHKNNPQISFLTLIRQPFSKLKVKNKKVFTRKVIKVFIYSKLEVKISLQHKNFYLLFS